MTLNNNQITKIDPRMEKYKVSMKKYKTDLGFNKIIGVKGENYAVSSRNGDLRLYNQIGYNAKNVLPSLFGDKVLCIDNTKDGNLLLLTFKKYLLLFPAFQNGQSAFTTTFPKNDKPMPRVLKISPKILLNIDEENLSFNSGKFNEKRNEKESFIIANSNNYLFFWNLKDVLKGHLICT